MSDRRQVRIVSKAIGSGGVCESRALYLQGVRSEASLDSLGPERGMSDAASGRCGCLSSEGRAGAHLPHPRAQGAVRVAED